MGIWETKSFRPGSETAPAHKKFPARSAISKSSTRAGANRTSTEPLPENVHPKLIHDHRVAFASRSPTAARFSPDGTRGSHGGH
jgi:hypothetical protein